MVGSGCIEVAALLDPEGPIFGPPDNSTDSTGNDNSANDNAGNDNSANDNTANDNASNDNVANDNVSNDNADNDNSTDEGIPPLPSGAQLTTTDTGLQYYDFNLGSGDRPEASDSVVVNYVGYLPDGTIFDSGDAVAFGLGGVVAGFREGIMGMSPGGRRRLVIPPDLGYGPGGNPGAGIGGTDTITFDVDLLSIQ
jgi:FKBP-type peptidyl-prolyl cis-trans isomerase